MWYSAITVSCLCYYYFTVVIEVEFAQSLFSRDESSGMVEARLMASGFSQWPYKVVVVPTESDPPNAEGVYLFMYLHDL